MVEYPLHSNVPRTEVDKNVDYAKRHGYASCVQWRNSMGSIEKPANPYLQPYNGVLAEAWETGWMTAVATLEGRHY